MVDGSLPIYIELVSTNASESPVILVAPPAANPVSRDPSPTNMRLGIFAQLYNDGYNKVNFLFDANKLLVTRYQMMDWDGDGIVGGYDEFGSFIDESDPTAVYNKDGKKEYDSKGYFDDPWYFSIFTAWLDDWVLGGDIDYSGDRIIGGYTWDEELDVDPCRGLCCAWAISIDV